MSFVVTLVSNPTLPAISEETILSVRKALPNQSTQEVLREGFAYDFILPVSTPIEGLEDKLRDVLKGAAVDVFLQPVAGRKKKLLIADMDSTMIGQECIDELAAEVGLKDKVADITERAMRGEIDFEPALKERVQLLKKLKTSVIAQTLENRISLNSGAKELIATMKANGAYTALVSGGFTVFTREIAKQVGFDENRANTLIEEAGELTGQVQLPILGQLAKQERLEQLMKEKGLSKDETLAVGDGANDLAMIAISGLGVAYHAKPKVAAAADARVDNGDLTSLLYIQGYKYEEFIR
ncbi:phosphoserine phosphatase SerB [Flexibacterium corallicola]|uniref:phosphoserine phosphatase SerB n=1 Tax=Flexibacterium corallicola TaxID=3037259 RepID=UPI00286EE4A9|nr:phosphoserine phosphatase SerB [Pseudovibrio sp. M1P-2-3]